MPDIKTAWDKIASLYHKKYLIKTNTVHYGPLCPGENKLKLLGNICGLRVVDLGCGAGQNAISLAKSKAVVTAVDFSSRQLIEAEKLALKEEVSIKFINSDVADMPVLKDEIFDIAISACTMAFVPDLEAAFSEAYRIIKTGGNFIVSVMHPLQYILDGEEDAMYFNSAYPFKPRLLKWRWDFEDRSIRFQHYLRSISEYHNCLTKAGFMVKKMLEPKPTLNTPHISLSKEIMKDYPYIAGHLPVTLIFVARKPMRNDEEKYG